MSYKQLIGVEGVLRATITTDDPDGPDKAVIEGMDITSNWHRDPDTGVWTLRAERHNAFVNSGLQNMLDRWASGTGTSPTRIAVSSDNTAVIAGTTTFGGTFRSSLFNGTFPSRVNQTTSFQSTFTKGAAANQIDFSVRKLGLTTASTDAAGAVQDIIGGAGVAPYNEPLTIDLSAMTSFNFIPQIDVSLIAV